MGAFAILAADAKVLGCTFETLLGGKVCGYVNAHTQQNSYGKSLTWEAASWTSSGEPLFESSSLLVTNFFFPFFLDVASVGFCIDLSESESESTICLLRLGFVR